GEAQHVEGEEGRPQEILVRDHPAVARLVARRAMLPLRLDRDPDGIPPRGHSLEHGMARRILEMPPGRDRLLEEEETEHDDPRDRPVARKAKRLPVDVERIETAADRLHIS